MKRTNKKGFTIVELVVVIAVIAILSAILIPTFSNVTKDAKEKAAIADARAIATQYLADHVEEADGSTIYVDVKGVYYAVTNGVATKYTVPADKTMTAIDCSANPDHANCAKVVTITP